MLGSPFEVGLFLDLAVQLAAALADINAAVGSGYFSIGAAVLSGGGDYIFGFSGDEPGNSGGTLNSVQQLVLTTVPEPSAFSLATLGAGVFLLASRAASRRAIAH